MKICTLCQSEKDIDQFNRKANSPDGKQNVCKECNRARSRKYYLENHDKHRKAVKEKNLGYKKRNRDYLFDYFSTHPCVDCGNTDIRVLEFDHLPGVDKVDGVGRLVSGAFSLDLIKTEISKCEVRCRNCHQIKTFERMGGNWHDAYIETIE